MLDLVLWKVSPYCNTLRVTYLTNNRKKSTEARVLRDQILLSGRPLRLYGRMKETLPIAARKEGTA